jgi:hypothetical protein
LGAEAAILVAVELPRLAGSTSPTAATRRRGAGAHMSKRNTQAQDTPELTANGEAMLKLLTDIVARLTALETPAEIVPTPTDEAKPAPERKLTKAEKAAKKASKTRREGNIAAGRMENALYACRKDGCNFQSFRKPADTKHARKEGVDGHESFSL